MGSIYKVFRVIFVFTGFLKSSRDEDISNTKLFELG